MTPFICIRLPHANERWWSGLQQRAVPFRTLVQHQQSDSYRRSVCCFLLSVRSHCPEHPRSNAGAHLNTITLHWSETQQPTQSTFVFCCMQIAVLFLQDSIVLSRIKWLFKGYLRWVEVIVKSLPLTFEILLIRRSISNYLC